MFSFLVYPLLLMVMASSLIAMEDDVLSHKRFKKEDFIQEEQFDFEKLPFDLRKVIIGIIAQKTSQGNVVETISAVKNLWLVNKEWYKYLNSENGFNVLFQNLLANFALKSEFIKLESRKGLDKIKQMRALRPIINNKLNYTLLLLSLLGTSQAKIKFKEEVGKQKTYVISNFINNFITIMNSEKTPQDIAILIEHIEKQLIKAAITVPAVKEQMKKEFKNYKGVEGGFQELYQWLNLQLNK
jgi:hypothetical protein